MECSVWGETKDVPWWGIPKDVVMGHPKGRTALFLKFIMVLFLERH
jgi:hypothetical protein